jgi:hypothetical protein
LIIIPVRSSWPIANNIHICFMPFFLCKFNVYIINLPDYSLWLWNNDKYSLTIHQQHAYITHRSHKINVHHYIRMTYLLILLQSRWFHVLFGERQPYKSVMSNLSSTRTLHCCLLKSIYEFSILHYSFAIRYVMQGTLCCYIQWVWT